MFPGFLILFFYAFDVLSAAHSSISCPRNWSSPADFVPPSKRCFNKQTEPETYYDLDMSMTQDYYTDFSRLFPVSLRTVSADLADWFVALQIL